MVWTVPGRRSGQPRSTLMTPFELNGGLYIVAGYPGADWACNARAAGTGTLTRGRKSRNVRIVELETDDARPVLRAFPTEVPIGVGFYKRSGLVRQGTPTNSKHSQVDVGSSGSIHSNLATDATRGRR